MKTEYVGAIGGAVLAGTLTLFAGPVGSLLGALVGLLVGYQVGYHTRRRRSDETAAT